MAKLKLPISFKPASWKVPQAPDEHGQALVFLAISFFALLAFIGLVTDAGSLYVSYTQLQRAVDAAAVAAANNIKYPQATYAERKAKITEAAREMIAAHDITGVSELTVYLCDDSALPGFPAVFGGMCPNPGQPPRKLAYVMATQLAPVYFLHIFGVESVTLKTSAVGEAAAVDMVLVFDTSESMGVNTPGYDPRNFIPAAYDPDDIEPLHTAKTAAQSLALNLFDGYDQIAIVTFDYNAQVQFNLSSDLFAAYNAIDDLIALHDDPPAALLPWTSASPWGGYRTFNPLYPDDRDGNGFDADPGKPCTDAFVNNVDGTLGAPGRDMWDDGPGANAGNPCDRDDILDAYDWNNNGDHDDDNIAPPSGLPFDPSNGIFEGTSVLSTCQGCGIREAINVLRAGGRQTSVWVIVFLSDGVANLSDTHATNSFIPASFRYGFCGADPSSAFWSTYCIDPATDTYQYIPGSPDASVRYCIDADSDECPPGSTPTNFSGPYSVEDYARDMVDEAGLTASTNPNEPRGEDIVMYSIGLGTASAGEPMLRYMADVGDEGARGNDACYGDPTTTADDIAPLHNCGNYYYSPTAAYLDQIFESIANRIFTKISR